MDSDDGRLLSINRSQLHDVKNRLTVVKGIAQLLARQVRRDDWQRDRILERVETLEREIDSLERTLYSVSNPIALRGDGVADRESTREHGN
jgi:nitrogen-specific signal transduction histidine kinase